ncbi:MAG TPA: hypothetical protein VGH73_09860 [Thermoanaerobaculia bacterium]|jgi:hypothetical protein
MERWFALRQRRAGRLALTIGLGALLASSSMGWAVRPPAAEAFGIQGPEGPRMLKPVRPTPSEAAGIALGTLPEVRLEAVDRNALLREDAIGQRTGRVKALRYGVGRDVQVAVRDGNWYDLAGGARLWAGEIVSTDALGLRLHLKSAGLPAGAVLAIYSPTSGSPTSGAAGVARNGYARFDPERHVEFYESSETLDDLWTGSFAGDRVRVEYLAPAGAAAAALPFAVDRLQHLYLDPVAQLAKSLVVGEKDAAGSCENDVTCYPEWANVARAVSGVGIVGQDALFCTGQLLATQAQDLTPYWLTANHCISRPREAKSSEFFWLYQTATCNGNPPSLASVPRSRGAALVSTSPVSDYTLLLITGALPDGLYWAGWTGIKVPDGTDAVGIHHPNGDYKRISFGTKADKSACYDFQGTAGLSVLRITWNDGVTEPGSSGSGIFRADTQQLFGQLFYGPSSCDAIPSDRFDCYGAFFTTYPRIKNFLKAGPDDSAKRNDTCRQASAAGVGTAHHRVVKVNAPDWYKISVPPGQTATVQVNFINADGDIDLAGYTGCGGDAAVTSTGENDSETISLSNRGSQPAFVYWKVYLNSSTRNDYAMTVSLR